MTRCIHLFRPVPIERTVDGWRALLNLVYEIGSSVAAVDVPETVRECRLCSCVRLDFHDEHGRETVLYEAAELFPPPSSKQ